VRTWAAPVVLTVALAPWGCAKDKQVEERTSNPPPPEEEKLPKDPKDPKDPKGPTPITTFDAGTPTQVAKAGHLGEIYRRAKDGPCEFDVSFECEPDEKCNPPPPREVDCGNIPNADGMQGDVYRRSDGKCNWEQETKCPPNVPCNPPPPTEIPCPE
jgi:hypothetical protein